MKNPENRTIVLEIVEEANGNGLTMAMEIKGFNPIEVIGLLEMKKAEIIKEMTDNSRRTRLNNIDPSIN
jgi:hypothetical protein